MAKKNIRLEISYEDFTQMVMELYEGERPITDKVIEKKANDMYLHELYSKSIDKSLPEAEREAARKEYLDKKGIPDAFRWSAQYQNKRLNNG